MLPKPPKEEMDDELMGMGDEALLTDSGMGLPDLEAHLGFGTRERQDSAELRPTDGGRSNS